MLRQLQENLFREEMKEDSGALQQTREVSAAVLEELVKRFAQVQRGCKDISVRQDKIENNLQSLMESMKSLQNRYVSQIKRVETYINSSVQDISSKLSHMAGKMTEKKGQELRTQQLVENHQQVVQKFDARINTLQKMISEQELKLTAYKQILRDMSRK